MNIILRYVLTLPFLGILLFAASLSMAFMKPPLYCRALFLLIAISYGRYLLASYLNTIFDYSPDTFISTGIENAVFTMSG